MNPVAPGYIGPVTLVYNVTGRAAHLTFKVVDPVRETTYFGPSGAGVEEDETYIYTMDSFTFPSVLGDYRSSWYDDGVLIVDSVDEFQISYTASYVAGTPSGSDLTTLAQAKNWLAISDTSQDSRLQQLITAASHAVMEYAQREFAPSGSAGVTRQFALKRDGLVTFGKYDLQTATSVQIDTESGGSPTTLTTDQYQLLPIDEPHGVYRSLRFYTFAIGPVLRQAFGLYRHVGVTGTWGFPSVPSDVEQAALVTVAKWFKRDEVAWSNEMPAPSFSDGLNLPFDARMLLQPYKRGV